MSNLGTWGPASAGPSGLLLVLHDRRRIGEKENLLLETNQERQPRFAQRRVVGHHHDIVKESLDRFPEADDFLHHVVEPAFEKRLLNGWAPADDFIREYQFSRFLEPRSEFVERGSR